MLADAELRVGAERFGVDDQQVRRDHLISHVLAAISAVAGESVIFFGGTALARSVLVDGRRATLGGYRPASRRSAYRAGLPV